MMCDVVVTSEGVVAMQDNRSHRDAIHHDCATTDSSLLPSVSSIQVQLNDIPPSVGRPPYRLNSPFFSVLLTSLAGRC